MQQLFFELIQVSLGNRDMLSRVPTEEEWDALFEAARKQAVAGVTFMGISRYVEITHKKQFERFEKFERFESENENLELGTLNLEHKSSDDDEEFDESWLEAVNLPEELYYTWMQQAMDGEQKYLEYKEAHRELFGFYRQNNIPTMLIKGYGLAELYPIPSHRPTGDIDIYQFGKWKEGDDAVNKQLGIEINNRHHHHSTFKFHDFLIENHYDFINTHSHKSTRNIEAQLKQLADASPKTPDELGIIYPSCDFNALFLIRHIAIHFAANNMNMRQLLDWALFVKKSQHDINWDKAWKFYEETNMWKFVLCVEEIAINNLGFSRDIFHIPSKYADFGKENEQLLNHVRNDIISPEVDKIGKKKGIGYVFSRLHIWWANRWKHEIVYSDSLFNTFCYQLVAHVKKPDSIWGR